MIQYLHKFFLLLSLSFLVLAFSSHSTQAQIRNTFTDAERERMHKEATDLIEKYISSLNDIGIPNNNFRLDDIGQVLSTLLEGSNVRVYDDLSRENADSTFLSAREYLDRIHLYYPNGIKFEYSFNLKNPCYQRIDDRNFYFVKAEVVKKIEGVLSLDNGMNINKDSLDIYVRFPILQNRPSLKTGLAKIYLITDHNETDCPENDIITPVLREEEISWLEDRAEIFIKDFALTLNIIGDPVVKDRYNTLDYFYTRDVKVYNDLAPQFLLDQFVADEYLQYIELWFQQGITFDYKSIKATNVLLEPDYVSVEVEVDRTIKVPVKGFADRQGLRFFVRFPFLENGLVGAERITPRIIRIESKERKTNDREYFAVGVQLNAMNYFGDLNPVNTNFRPTWALTRPGIGIHAIKKLNPFVFVRGSFSTGRIFGDDFTAADPNDETGQFRYIRNLHFRNRITEFSLTAMVDLRPNKGLYYRRNLVTPYLFGGIALAFHNPQARGPGALRNTWIDLKPLRTEGQGLEGYGEEYSLVQPVIPFGLGVKIRLGYRFDLGIEAGIRYTFTDYLDDVSGTYPDPGDLPDPFSYEMSNRSLENAAAFRNQTRNDLARLLMERAPGAPITFTGSDGRTYTTFNGYGRPGEQRGGSRSNDFYMSTGFHLTYLLRVGRPQAPIRTPDYDYNFGE